MRMIMRTAPVGKPADPSGQLRRDSLGIVVMLLVQYGLGVGVNLYVTVPRSDQGAGLAPALGRALTHSPAVLALHAALGLVLLGGAIHVLRTATRSRRWPAIAASATGLLAIVGAAVSGASFVNTGKPYASLTMAILTGVALLCYLYNLVAPGARKIPPGMSTFG